MSYNPSIIQHDLNRCYLCGRCDEKLDRHEVFGSANREKSKRLGLWVVLCHNRCHLNGVHAHRDIREPLQAKAQKAAMEAYGWTAEDFYNEFHKMYL